MPADRFLFTLVVSTECVGDPLRTEHVANEGIEILRSYVEGRKSAELPKTDGYWISDVTDLGRMINADLWEASIMQIARLNGGPQKLRELADRMEKGWRMHGG